MSQARPSDSPRGPQGRARAALLAAFLAFPALPHAQTVISSAPNHAHRYDRALAGTYEARERDWRQGAVVYQVTDRVQQALGLQPGDVIIQINRTPVTDAQQAARVLEYYSGRGPIRMFFERAGTVYSTDFRIS